MIVINVTRISDGRDSKHQISIPRLAIFGYHKGFVFGNQPFFFKHIHIFDNSVFAFPDSSVNRFVAWITGVGSPVLALHQKSIDGNFLRRQPEVENSIRQRKVITHRERAVIPPLRRLVVFIHIFVPPFFVSCGSNFKRKEKMHRAESALSALLLHYRLKLSVKPANLVVSRFT